MKKLLAILLCLCMLPLTVACSGFKDSYGTYEDIIAEYKELLSLKQGGSELPAPDAKKLDERESEIATALRAIVEENEPEKLGYGFKDMDGNGTPELFLLNKSTPIFAIFTISDKKPIVLDYAEGSRERWLFGRDGYLYTGRATENGETGDFTVYKAHISGDALVYDSIYGYVKNTETNEIVEYFQIVDGVRSVIDSSEYYQLNVEYGELTNVNGAVLCKLAAPRIHSGLETEEDASLPVADFSGYEAIRRTYQAMVEAVPDFSFTDWVPGKYDALFSFSDDADYETYHQLLYITRNQGNRMGYCETDLNGDGTAELVLMNDAYSIMAIFTTVKGKVVPVKGFGEFLYDWEISGITADGKIYGSRRSTIGLGMENAVYQLTTEGTLENVVCYGESWLTDSNGYYKIENGKRTELTYEEYQALDASMDVFDFQSYGSGGEIVRNALKISFTPLFGAADPMQIETPVTWENMQIDSLHFTLKTVTEQEATFTLCDTDAMGNETKQLISATASLRDGKYIFDGGRIKGYLEFGVNKVWLIVESSEDEDLTPRAYLFYWSVTN